MATYATWNPSDKGANVTLSNGNLTAANSAGGGQTATVRATIGVSTGKWYWEYTVLTASVNVVHGIANSSAGLTTYLGGDANGWGYAMSDGHKYNNNSGSVYGATYTVGDVIGVALDMDTGIVTMYKNNTTQGTMFTGLTGTLYPTTSLYSGASNDSLTANFGATALTYTPPSGYNAGVYTVSGPANVKTINGLALASVKTVNGLAIASVKSFNGLA